MSCGPLIQKRRSDAEVVVQAWPCCRAEVGIGDRRRSRGHAPSRSAGPPRSAANRKFCSTSSTVKPRCLDLANGPADLLHDHGGQTLGRLVEQQQAWRRCAGFARWRASAARRPTAWFPGSPRAPSGWGTARRSWEGRVRPGAITRGSIRFSVTLRPEKMPRSSGQMAMPARAILSDRRPAISRAVDVVSGPRSPSRPCPMMELQRGGLAGAVAAKQRHHLAGAAR